MLNNIELSTLRAKFMDRYNEVMSNYQYAKDITDSAIDKIHDKNLALKEDL